MISSELMLQMILAVSQFCSVYHWYTPNRQQCVKELWLCARQTTEADTMPGNLFNCISHYQESKSLK